MLQHQGSKKSAVRSSGSRRRTSGSSRFFFRGSNLSFSLFLQASRLPTVPLNKQTKSCPGQAKCESYLSDGKLEFKSLSSPDYILWHEAARIILRCVVRKRNGATILCSISFSSCFLFFRNHQKAELPLVVTARYILN